MNDWLPIVNIITVIITVIGGGIFMLVNRKGGEKSKREPSWGELVEENRDLRKELDDFRRLTDDRFALTERKVSALVQVITTVMDQWPTEQPAPTIEQTLLDTLADTLPPWFRHRPSGRARPRRA